MNEKKNNIQLYNLVRKLSSYIPNEDDLSTILGYSILKSLINFNTKTTSKKEIKIEEMKKIYSFLDELITSYEKNDSYDASLELISELDNKFEEWNNKYKSDVEYPNFESSFANKIIEDKIIGKTKNYSELMRRIGIRIQRETYENGPFSRTIDSLIKDYETLQYSFDIKGE